MILMSGYIIPINQIYVLFEDNFKFSLTCCLYFFCKIVTFYFRDVINQFPDILQEAVNTSGSNNFVLLIDGLDHLEIGDQMLDWLPLNLPHVIIQNFILFIIQFAMKYSSIIS